MAEEYNGTTTAASEGWDTGVADLNVFYDVSVLPRPIFKMRKLTSSSDR